MSILSSMSSGIPGGATTADQPVQTQANKTPDPLNVADEVANITSQNSLAMRSAKSKGNEIAASRGMQNSTLGAEAAQRAMVDAALPMAQQNVQQRFTSSENELGRQHDIKMQEDSVRANTVGEYLNAAKELQTSFFDAYKDIQSAEIPAAEKANAIKDLYAKQQQQLNQMKQLYGGLATTEKDWSDFADLLT
ncbi:hypothetical protein [Vibrio sp. TBV020]|uniref:hypothetical protein n=1 Tax=Vibrio sp. TBV020 TaxID=3137398 RepID=UPI0038CD2142